MTVFSQHRAKILRLFGLVFIIICLTGAPRALAASAEQPAAGNGKKPVAEILVQGDDNFTAMSEKARQLAAKSFEQPLLAPKYFTGLKMEDWKKIRFRSGLRPWKADLAGGFSVELCHPGSVYDRTVSFRLLEKDGAKDLPFTPDMFDYSALDASPESLAEIPPNFAGFRLLRNQADGGDERILASFIGASFFQSRGGRADFGLLARGLSIDTATPGGEQSPYFREFWLQKPDKNASSFTLYALLDSPSLTGVYRFVIKPGNAVIMDVVCKLYLRSGASAGMKLGIAPLNGMFLSSETLPGPVPDYRPEVHSFDGFLFTNGGGWTWRPLYNPQRLAIQTIAARNPRGFGLMQRDANFDHYQDLSARYERQTSLWVEPAGDWGEGNLELIEIPSRTDYHNNVHASWVPNPNGGGHKPEMAFAYRLYWMNPGVAPHKLGRVAATRLVRNREENTARFVIDFEGGDLQKLPANTGLSSVVETPENVPVLEKRLFKNEVTGGWRLDFKVRLPESKGMVQSLIATGDKSAAPLWFSALLKRGENLPEPLSETWNYPLHPLE